MCCRVPKVQDASRLRVGSARGFTLIVRNDRGFESALSCDQVFKFRTDEEISLSSRLLKTPNCHVVKLSIRDQRLFDHLTETRNQFPLRQRRQGLCVDEHRCRLVKRADKVFSDGKIDPRLATYGRINLR